MHQYMKSYEHRNNSPHSAKLPTKLGLYEKAQNVACVIFSLHRILVQNYLITRPQFIVLTNVQNHIFHYYL